MTNRERVQAVLAGTRPDRLPAVEWANWWSLTKKRWEEEGAPAQTGPDTLQDYFGLDRLRQIWIHPICGDAPKPPAEGAGLLETEEDYEALLPFLYREDTLQKAVDRAEAWREDHDRGDFAAWITLEGFFWFPRTLFGIENHLYAFYDAPELMHRMNRDLAQYHLTCLDRILPLLRPEYMTFAEDMSYNLGPMLSKELSAIDWKASAREVHNKVRGLSPWPTAHTLYHGKRMKILETEVFPEKNGEPGKAFSENGEFFVYCGSGAVRLVTVQPENSKRMAGKAFLLGHPLDKNTVLG